MPSPLQEQTNYWIEVDEEIFTPALTLASEIGRLKEPWFIGDVVKIWNWDDGFGLAMPVAQHRMDQYFLRSDLARAIKKKMNIQC